MEGLKRVGVRVWTITLVATLLSALPGCGENSDAFERVNSNKTLKTPSEVLKEAKAKSPPPATKAP
jgi:hypothetical protein